LTNAPTTPTTISGHRTTFAVMEFAQTALRGLMTPAETGRRIGRTWGVGVLGVAVVYAVMLERV